MKRIIALATLIPSICLGVGVVDDAKGIVNVAKCLYKKTSTMCLVEDIFNKNDSVIITPATELYGKSAQYYLMSDSPNWRKVSLGPQKREDLLLVESNQLGFIETHFLPGTPVDVDKLAKKPLMTMSNNLQSEPDKIEADFWPWIDNGAIYQICYHTEKKTVECMISAAANLPNGHVTLYSLVGDASTANDSALQIIASIDVPKE